MFSTPLFAQDDEWGEEKKEKKEITKISVPNATVKFNVPVLFLDPKHAFFVATDTRLGKYFSLDMGMGYYFLLNNRAYYEDESFSGFRGRVGIKYYYIFGQRLAPYVGFEGMLNRFNIKEYQDICRFGCQYNETFLTNREVKAMGLAARTGLMIFMGKQKRLFFDVYAGVGYKYLEISDDIPSDAEIIGDRGWFGNLYDSDPGDYHVGNVILGIYFGYAFW